MKNDMLRANVVLHNFLAVGNSSDIYHFCQPINTVYGVGGSTDPNLEEMTMSKLTPIILAAIMLASTSLVALDWAELEENKMTEADGRTGADASVEILSPRQTTVDLNGEKLHTLDAGEETEFELYVENIGDVDIEEMGISLTIYLDENGARGPIAKDCSRK